MRARLNDPYAISPLSLDNRIAVHDRAGSASDVIADLDAWPHQR